MNSIVEIHAAGAAAWFADELDSLATSATVFEEEPLLVERTARGGSMAPLLCRDMDETYRVVDGEVTFFVGDEVVKAGPGDIVVAPAGAARTFRVESDSARWLVLTRVTSLDHYRDFGLAVAAPLPSGSDWPSEDELAAVQRIAAVNGIELIAPPGTLPTSSL